MIRVKYVQRYRKRKLVMSGHAEAGPENHDLVCAATSMLAITLKEALSANDIRYHLDLGDGSGGFFSLRCRDRNAAGIFNTVLCGLEALRAIDVEYIGG